MSDIAPIITAAAALVALTGGYIQFVLRRAIHPCIELDVEFSILNHPENRFIQPGVTQWYRKPLALPADTCLIHVWARFEYQLAVGSATILIAKLLRQPRGPNPTEYMVRRTFAIEDSRR